MNKDAKPVLGFGQQIDQLRSGFFCWNRSTGGLVQANRIRNYKCVFAIAKRIVRVRLKSIASRRTVGHHLLASQFIAQARFACSG
jgi:hypothetical protein